MNEIKDVLMTEHQALSKNQTVAEVLSFMEDFEFSHFPVVESGVYLGSVVYDEFLFLEKNKLVNDYLYTTKGFFGYKKDDVLTLLDLFSKNKTNVLPIINDKKKYVGYCLIEDLVELFCNFPFLNEYGSVLVVSKETDNYSMSQVAQIIESNNFNLFGMVVSKMDVNKVEITIKLNQDIGDSLIQAFRRYGYDIVNIHDEDSYLLKLKERSDYLSKYLDI